MFSDYQGLMPAKGNVNRLGRPSKLSYSFRGLFFSKNIFVGIDYFEVKNWE
jgi:hypothetical protein